MINIKISYAPRGGLLIRNEHGRYLPRPKRNRMEIYNDVLNAIARRSIDGEAKPTRVQILSNLAYDKLVRYLDELESKKMIVQAPLGITERGRDFLQDYDRIKDFILAMNVKYLDISESEIYEC
jgi:predicted transcriptional regulator